MTFFFHVFLLTSSLYLVYCYDATSLQALVARIDALEETAEIQKEQIQSQTESIQILRIKDEKQQRRIEELEKIVQVQQKVINDVIPRAKEAKSQEETPEVALESTIKDEIKTVTEFVDGSEKNTSGLGQIRKSLNIPSRRSIRQTPEAVAFHATIDVLTHVTQLTQGQTVVFDSVHLNVGGGYHSSAGLFIAPAPGIYLFSVSVMLNTGTESWIDLDLIKNGAVLSGAYAYQFDQGSVSVVTQLKIGDEVLVKVHGSNIGMVYGEKLTSFIGVLLTHL